MWLDNANDIYQLSGGPKIEYQTECRGLLSQKGYAADVLGAGYIYRLLQKGGKRTMTSAQRFEDKIALLIEGSILLADL